MQKSKLYLIYGISLAALGLLGFLVTHAKSALISGLASGALMLAFSFFVEKVKIVDIIARIGNILLIGVFAWRSSLAIMAVNNGNQNKLIPAIILSVMAVISVVVLVMNFLNKKKKKDFN